MAKRAVARGLTHLLRRSELPTNLAQSSMSSHDQVYVPSCYRVLPSARLSGLFRVVRARPYLAHAYTLGALARCLPG
ncbi:hypothetical protein CRG98_001187 [Punica granatum]|uniref:Uncharacterized protein n=1 Tax=Punica granatum TaxID=22663 RepID=A0A2I0LCK7_PUNGR|nr:hypothetical protein CRG98_001187 [Punica granatum]